MSDDAETQKQDVSRDSQEQESIAPSSSDPGTEAQPAPTAWQAIFSPQYNAYYFFNTETQQTTWENPLQPTASSSSTSSPVDTPAVAGPSSAASESASPEPQAGPSAGPTQSAATAHYAALQAAAIAQGIDPALAHLDPSLLSSLPSGAAPSGAAPPTFTAKFNARTGQFTAPNARDPSHLNEFERAKRMSEFYFDVGKWEEDLAKKGGSLYAEDDGEGGEGSGKKRKRPTKKDIERFKEQKRLKKIAKTAWLRT